MSALSSNPSSLSARRPASVARPRLIRLASLGLLVALCAALLAGVPGLRRAVDDVSHIGLGWLALAIALELGSAGSFVVLFRLFFDRLDARDARALAWTEQ